MKKYKLISKYPGSPKLGTILSPKIDVENTNTNNYYWEGSWFNPSNFTEFWEEVVALDYEVIQVLYATEIRTLFDDEYRLFSDGIGFDLEYLLNNNGRIHSVKRLSDGEVFTVGDRISVSDIGISDTITEIVLADSVKWASNVVTKEIFLGCENDHQYILSSVNKPAPLDYEILSYVKKGSTTCHTTKRRGGERHEEFWDIRVVKRLSDGEVSAIGNIIKTYEHGRPHRIKSISLAKGKDSIKQGIWLNYDYGAQHFSRTIKVKDKLLTTEDGVDIYVGDQTWILHKNSWDLSPKPTKHNNVSWFQSGEPAHWSFSTREAAEAYMLNNKPCLSLNDIRRSLSLSTPKINQLITLIKAKIV